jgi:hypothetical protein
MGLTAAAAAAADNDGDVAGREDEGVTLMQHANAPG